MVDKKKLKASIDQLDRITGDKIAELEVIRQKMKENHRTLYGETSPNQLKKGKEWTRLDDPDGRETNKE